MNKLYNCMVDFDKVNIIEYLVAGMDNTYIKVINPKGHASFFERKDLGKCGLFFTVEEAVQKALNDYLVEIEDAGWMINNAMRKIRLLRNFKGKNND